MGTFEVSCPRCGGSLIVHLPLQVRAQVSLEGLKGGSLDAPSLSRKS